MAMFFLCCAACSCLCCHVLISPFAISLLFPIRFCSALSIPLHFPFRFSVSVPFLSPSISYYYRVDCDINATPLAQRIVAALKSTSKALCIDIAWVLQGEDEDELPERVLGQLRLSHLALNRAMPMPPSLVDSLTRTNNFLLPNRDISTSSSCFLSPHSSFDFA